MKNLFIVIEGLDGSGKDTLILSLVDELKKKDKYVNIWLTREPTKITKSGRKIKEYLKSDNFNKEDALKLYIQDRIEHTDLIKENLKHSFVISSRYDLSTFIYQGTQGIDLDYMVGLHKNILKPDFTFYLNVKPDILIKRINQRNEPLEYFEKQKLFLEKASKYALEAINTLKNKYNREDIYILDGNKDKNDVLKQILDVILKEN